MHLEDVGSIGYQVGAAGIVLFTLAFLVVVRWWTDWLGRVVALALTTTSGVLIITTLRQLNLDLPGGILWWRFFCFWAFGVGVWTALSTFVWAQFLAPRLQRKPRMTTRREYRQDEEANRADSGHGSDGDSDGLPGGDAG